MKRLIPVLILALSVITLIFTAASCGSNNDSSDELTKEMKAYFEDLYDLFNNKNFEEYVEHFAYDEEKKASMLENFNMLKDYTNTTQKILEIRADMTETGEVAVYLLTEKSSEIVGIKEVNSVIQEKKTFILEKIDGEYFIVSFIEGKGEIISYNGPDDELLKKYREEATKLEQDSKDTADTATSEQ